jgi:hypothetical protein
MRIVLVGAPKLLGFFNLLCLPPLLNLSELLSWQGIPGQEADIAANRASWKLVEILVHGYLGAWV